MTNECWGVHGGGAGAVAHHHFSDGDGTMTGFASPLLLLLLFLIVIGAGHEDQTCLDNGTCENGEDSPCADYHESCEFWAGRDPSECDVNPIYMSKTCRMSCKLCTPRLDLGVEQTVSGDRASEVKSVVANTLDYMKNIVMVDPKYEKVRDGCKNQHHHCSYWTVIGECERLPGFMDINCAPACQTCEKLSFETRCPLDPNEPNCWGPGDLNKMFENIISEPKFQKYEPRILSRPDYPKGESEKTVDYQIGPWVVALENFLSVEECETLIELGHVEKYQRSSEVGKENFDGTRERSIAASRTSENAWCQHECAESPVSQNINKRIENVTGIPEKNSEMLQLLRYEVGQFYKTHHDYIPYERERQQGVRLVTMFLYLNDVEEGGGTNFPKLNLTVMPKQGKAVIWPSVLDQDPNSIDNRTVHQALPVIKGVKYGANAWLHQRDFKTANKNNCQ